ncbi:MAG: DnaJ domain-containing protein [Candidatus Muiribacteriota bacterium]
MKNFLKSMELIKSFRILGLSANSTLSEVKKKYRLIARETHPDICPENNYRIKKFTEATEAYNKLYLYFSSKFKGYNFDEDLSLFLIKAFLPDIYIKVKNFKHTEYIEYERKVCCLECRNKPRIKCFKCKGNGRILFKSGQIKKKILCSKCYGRTYITQCNACGGQGFIIEKRAVHIKKFKKISPEKYVLKNQGNKYKKICSDVYIVAC